MALQFPNKNQPQSPPSQTPNYQPYQPPFDNSPYNAPQTPIEEYRSFGEHYNDGKFWSLNGRIGRVQYIVYPLALIFLLMLIMMIFFISGGAIALLLSNNGGQGIYEVLSRFFLFILPLWLVVTVFIFIHTIRRLNDINRSGWFSVLLFVPLINFFLFLALWLIPGTDGENDYGLPAKPPSMFLKIVAGLVLLLNFGTFFLGMGIAIADNMSNQSQQVSENTEVITEGMAQAKIDAQNTQNNGQNSVQVVPAQAVNDNSNQQNTNSGQQLNTETIVFTAEDLAKKSGMPLPEETMSSEQNSGHNIGVVIEPAGQVAPPPSPQMPPADVEVVQPAVVNDPTVVAVPQTQPQQQGGMSYNDFVKTSDKPIFSD